MRRLLLSVLFAVLWPAPSRACTPPPPIGWRGILPVDGATAVPTNVRIALDYFGRDSQALDDVIVRPMGGQAIDVTIQMGITSHPLRHLVLLHPTTPLAANTTFEILTRIPTVPCYQEPCVAATHSVAAVFTTGSGPDTVAPSYGGLTSGGGGIQSCDNSACCGPYRIVAYGFESSTPTDDIALAGLNLYRVGSGLVSELTSLSGFQLCSGLPTGGGPRGDFMAPTGTFYAHAVDLAGNEDSNMQLVTISASCGSANPPDAGPDAAGFATPPSAGCGCSVAQPGNPAFILILIAFFVTFVHRVPTHLPKRGGRDEKTVLASVHRWAGV